MSGLLVRILSGWRLVEVRGRGAERLVSTVISQGYRIWGVTRHGDALFLTVTEDGFERMGELAVDLDLELITHVRGGLPFRWRQLRRRPFLLVGLATALLIVGYATTHVWAIKVVAPDLSGAAQTEIIQAAEASGLRVGVSRRALDIAQIRRAMLSRLPAYAWIGIHTQGMVAIIEGLRFVNRPAYHLPPRLVADRPGRVTAIFVYMGAPHVAIGQEVKKGEVLIAGVISDVSAHQPKDAKEPVHETVLTPAEGEVYADVSYQSQRFQPFKREEYVLTGKRTVRHFIAFDEGPVVAIPPAGPPNYAHYRIQKIVTTLKFAQVDLPVRLIDMVYNEEVRHTVPQSRREALFRARREARTDLDKKVPQGGQRVASRERVRWTSQGVWVTMTWVVNSNIAVAPKS